MQQNNSLSKTVLLLGGIAGLAGLTFLLKHYLSPQKQQDKTVPEQPPLSIEKTRQLMQEIKYQMLVVCINYGQKLNRDMLKFIPVEQMEAAKQKLKANILKNYQAKENVILQKHLVSKQDYAHSLMAFENDHFIATNRNQIFNMMEKAIAGEHPDLTVPPEALTVNSLDETKKIYQDICLMISIEVWKKMKEWSLKDCSFDTSNDNDFKKAIREINIYQMKVSYFQGKGYSKEWGCPNQTFLKVIETHNLSNPDFKLIIRTIQQAYNQLIDVVSNRPLQLSEKQIQQIFIREIAKTATEEQAKKQKANLIKVNTPTSQTAFLLNQGRLAQKQLDKSIDKNKAFKKSKILEQKSSLSELQV